MRHGPALVHAIAREAAADVVVKSAKKHVVECSRHQLHELTGTGTQESAPHDFERGNGRKFHLSDRAAKEDVEPLTDAHRGGVHDRRVDLAAHIAVENLVELLNKFLATLCNGLRILA